MRHHLRTVLWEGRLAERWEEWQGGGNSSAEALKQGSVSAVSTVAATWCGRHLQKFLLFPNVMPHRFSLPPPWCDVTPPSSPSSLQPSEPVSFLYQILLILQFTEVGTQSQSQHLCMITLVLMRSQGHICLKTFLFFKASFPQYTETNLPDQKFYM